MGRSILVIEDHTDSRELLCDALEFAGYRVMQAADGEAGEAMVRSETPDAVILDMSLPKKSGWEVAESLRNDRVAIPILALTAHARQEDETRALEIGCSRYLPKPVKPRQVLQTLAELLPADGDA